MKPGYKQTEVGVIPVDWEVRQVLDLCEYQNGTSLEHLFSPDDGLKVISIGNYSVTGNYIDNGVHISRKHRRKIEKFVLRRNDLAMSLNDKTSVGAIIGRVLLIQEDDLFVFNQRTMRLRPKNNVSPSYLHHAINADRVHGAIVGLAKPGTQIYVNTDDVIELKLPVPPLPEQRAIATALSDVDALLAALDRLIAKKRDLKQAAMQQLLTGQTRLPGFKGKWETKRLGDVAIIRDGTHQTPKYVPVGIPFFSVEHVTSGDFKNTKFISVEEHQFLTRSFKIEKGDILMTRIGSIGDCKLIDWDVDASFYVSLALLKIRHGQSAAYIAHYSKSAAFQKEVELHSLQSAIPKKINLGPISNVKIELPPTIPEQTAIATVLSEMDLELAALEQRRDKTRALKQGMMQELLTGRTRLL